MKQPQDFIVGAQRSGTTLLRLMLNAHSLIAIPEEGVFWMPLLRRTNQLLRSPKQYKKHPAENLSAKEIGNYCRFVISSEQFKLWCFPADEYAKSMCALKEIPPARFMSGLYEAYARSRGKIIWGDKTPSFFRMIRPLSYLFPDARFIHIVRDGRDVFLSLKKMNRNTGNITAEALEWKVKVQTIRKSLAAHVAGRWIDVRYENLTSQPQAELERICGFISIEFEPAMLEFFRTSDQYIGKHHSDLIFKPVSTSSVEKWKKELSVYQQAKFRTIAGQLLSAYGYDTGMSGKYGIRAAIGCIADLLIGLPARALRIFLNRLNASLSLRFGIRIIREQAGEKPEARKETGR